MIKNKNKEEYVIYSITNLTDNKKYIGKTKNIKNREYLHRYLLNKNKHYNNHLQRAWIKYGEENFVFSIIKNSTKQKIDEDEMYYIEFFDSFLNGYNNSEGGNNPKWIIRKYNREDPDEYKPMSKEKREKIYNILTTGKP